MSDQAPPQTTKRNEPKPSTHTKIIWTTLTRDLLKLKSLFHLFTVFPGEILVLPRQQPDLLLQGHHLGRGGLQLDLDLTSICRLRLRPQALLTQLRLQLSYVHTTTRIGRFGGGQGAGWHVAVCLSCELAKHLWCKRCLHVWDSSKILETQGG